MLTSHNIYLHFINITSKLCLNSHIFKKITAVKLMLKVLFCDIFISCNRILTRRAMCKEALNESCFILDAILYVRLD